MTIGSVLARIGEIQSRFGFSTGVGSPHVDAASFSGLGVDEIVDIVEHIGERAVVITTDRELRERCAVYGVVSVWSDAFVEWANC